MPSRGDAVEITKTPQVRFAESRDASRRMDKHDEDEKHSEFHDGTGMISGQSRSTAFNAARTHSSTGT